MSKKRNASVTDTDESNVGEYAAKKPRHSVFAAFVCLILAVAVWMVTMYADDTVSVALEVSPHDAATWQCVLSDSSIEVKGDILSLKKATCVVVDLPDHITKPGTYVLTVEDLIFPEGVSPAKVLELTVTIENPKS